MKLARMPDGSPEIFHTIQGEGRNTGMPSVFIRASLCNLHCVWCDTDYTWNWEGTSFSHEKDQLPGYRKYRRDEMIVSLSAGEIAGIVRSIGCSNYVFTGGEPLIQEKDWVELMNLLGSGNHFEIETNGTLFPGGEFLGLVHQLNVSPKLRNSGVEESKRIKPRVLEQLAGTGKADFKFVVETPADFEEMELIVETARIGPDRVFLMPRASTLRELEENQAKVAEEARKRGYRYSDRLHLRLFGAKRGV